MLSQSIQAEVISMSKMQEIETRVVELATNFPPQEILAVFDIDMALTQPKNPAFQMPNMKKNRDKLKPLLKDITPPQKDILLNLMLQSSPSILVEKNTPQMLGLIEKTNIKTIALTASLSENIRTAEKIGWRYSTLKSLGIDFSSSFPQLDYLIFNQVKPYLQQKPIFYKGILCSNGEGSKTNKGDVLVLFLQQLNYQPKIVVFVDDKKENLENVQQALLQFIPNVNFIGIEYKGAEEFGSKDIDNNSKFMAEWTKLINQTQKTEQKYK
jgi:hypothetical protein